MEDYNQKNNSGNSYKSGRYETLKRGLVSLALGMGLSGNARGGEAPIVLPPVINGPPMEDVEFEPPRPVENPSSSSGKEYKSPSRNPADLKKHDLAVPYRGPMLPAPLPSPSKPLKPSRALEESSEDKPPQPASSLEAGVDKDAKGGWIAIRTGLEGGVKGVASGILNGLHQAAYIANPIGGYKNKDGEREFYFFPAFNFGKEHREDSLLKFLPGGKAYTEGEKGEAFWNVAGPVVVGLIASQSGSGSRSNGTGDGSLETAVQGYNSRREIERDSNERKEEETKNDSGFDWGTGNPTGE